MEKLYIKIKFEDKDQQDKFFSFIKEMGLEFEVQDSDNAKSTPEITVTQEQGHGNPA